MPRLARTSLLVGLAAVCCLALTPQPGHAQAAKKGNPVQFTTADGVYLKGTFYPAAKRDASVVLMLHSLGASEDSNKRGWPELAESLNAKGFAVLTFDFRGHGDSTSIDPKEFWGGKGGAVNQAKVKGIGRDSIEFKDFSKDYYPYLVNDIAAAKAYLDRQNDNGTCNTSSLVVLGAETGATLGTIWLNSEFYRYQFSTTQAFPIGQPFPVQQLKVEKDSEGKNVLACVWLSLTPTLSPTTVLSLHGELAVAAKENAVPQAFIYGSKDAKGERVAKDLKSFIVKGGAKPGKANRFQFTGDVAIPGGDEKLRGRGLLQFPGTNQAIAEYVENVANAMPREWMERDFRKSGYVWRFSTTQMPIYAKFPGETAMIWTDYRQSPFTVTNR